MKEQPRVIAICISPKKGEPMQSVDAVRAIECAGLEGDRYCTGEGSFSGGEIGRRQVTLINSTFFENSEFAYTDSRRNIVTSGVELMWLIGREFTVGQSVFRGVKYCDPCDRPSNLVRKKKSFKQAFSDRGGLIAEIVQSGLISVGDEIILPKKSY